MGIHPHAVGSLRERLTHVVWLGGGTRVGKTTLSRLLAGKYDLKLYNLDWHHVREHRSRGGAAMRWWDERGVDERWIVPGDAELLERSVAGWEEGFPLVIHDLLALRESRAILAEGPGALPWLVAPLITDQRQALWLVPTPEWRDDIARLRYGELGPLGDATDPQEAARKLRDRDLALNGRIFKECAALGIRCIEVDGSKDIDVMTALVEEHFRPHLPDTLNV